MKTWRQLLNLNDPDHDHDEKAILEVWMLAIQARYVLSDGLAVYQAVKNRRLLWATVGTHLVEGVLCSAFFLGHGSKDCFVFGLTCVLWTFLWLGAYIAMDYDNLEVKLRKRVKGLKRIKKNLSFTDMRKALGRSLDSLVEKRNVEEGGVEELEELVEVEEVDHKVEAKTEKKKITGKKQQRGRSRNRRMNNNSKTD